MDLCSMYLPDVMSYSAFRNPIYKDYERYPYGDERCGSKKPATDKARKRTPNGNGKNKDNCPFCQDQKRRPLGTYLRGKANQIQDSIAEEHEHEEEDDQVNNETDQSNTKTACTKAS